jgi:1,2-dihydroxy-3-keto-5-methylthiopentene dioxygenase
MATLTLRDSGEVLRDPEAIAAFLEPFGIWYRRFEGSDSLAPDASQADVLAAYDEPIQRLKAEAGYVTADVINILPETPNLDTLLARFSREHWHSEDEVRFVVHGRGLFHIHPTDGPVFSIEVRKGDMINVPQGTLHWFDLCDDRTIRAIRLFKDMSGWTPNYSESGVDARYQPLCFGQPQNLARQQQQPSLPSELLQLTQRQQQQ